MEDKVLGPMQVSWEAKVLGPMQVEVYIHHLQYRQADGNIRPPREGMVGNHANG